MRNWTNAPALTHKAVLALLINGASLPREAIGSKQKMSLQVQRHTLHSGFVPGSTDEIEWSQRGPHFAPQRVKQYLPITAQCPCAGNEQYHTFLLLCQDIKKNNANVTVSNFPKPMKKVDVSGWLSGYYLQTMCCRLE